jgi:hypothetical protein
MSPAGLLFSEVISDPVVVGPPTPSLYNSTRSCKDQYGHSSGNQHEKTVSNKFEPLACIAQPL